jgi:hypothetical protein
MPRPPIQRVTLTELRKLFNTEVLPRLANGDIIAVVRSEGQPNPRAQQPVGTRSQRVEYWGAKDGALSKIAVAHQYLRPDGTIGASGKPDPKRVLHEGIIYAPRLKSQR